MHRFNSGLSLAAAAAGLALSATAPAADTAPGKAVNAGDKVQCYGLSFCGHRCGASNHFCTNLDDCKAPWITTAKNCLDRGGSLQDPAKGDGPTSAAEKDS